MTGIYSYNGTPLLVFAITALLVGAAMVAGPFFGLGAKRKNPALESILGQIASHQPAAAPLKETYIADIVDAPDTMREPHGADVVDRRARLAITR
ncbi:hypothetical protein GCM10023063_16750 [Arthrobacter methylotrophus]|uniref:Uncharacterized protein n=1 Tax=Arthrobacter methylotrophus TaxID=121291 RepID=A0ABV5URL4_9MICC